MLLCRVSGDAKMIPGFLSNQRIGEDLMSMSSFRFRADVSYLFCGLTPRDNVNVKPQQTQQTSPRRCSGDLRGTRSSAQ